MVPLLRQQQYQDCTVYFLHLNLADAIFVKYIIRDLRHARIGRQSRSLGLVVVAIAELNGAWIEQTKYLGVLVKVCLEFGICLIYYSCLLIIDQER